MIKPNVSCVIVKKGGTDTFGRAIEGARKKAKCNVVKFIVSSVKSTVRADSSASRGRAQEEINEIVLLFPATSDIKHGDIVEILNERLVVQGIHTRFDVTGKLDHYEVALTVWA